MTSGDLPWKDRHPFAQVTYGRAFGPPTEVVDVPGWNCAVLSRPIPGSDLRDATGCYPFSPLAATVDLAAGLEHLRNRGFVSVVIVTDPFCQPSAEGLARAFGTMRPFKTHYAYDRSLGPLNYSRRHWREVRVARKALNIHEVPYAEYWEEFSRLYDSLIEAHHISGVAAFSSSFFQALTKSKGIRAVAAYLAGRIVSMMLFVEFDRRAYAFLAGTTDDGRANSAHYGLYAEALENLADYSIVNLGGAPGTSDDPEHGIAFAKRRLTNTTSQSYLCGMILDDAAYSALLPAPGRTPEYFPAYRGLGARS